MRLVDTNILLYGANADFAEHRCAFQHLQRQRERGAPWAVSWPIVYEFLRVATHRRVFSKPLKPDQAIQYLVDLFERDRVSILVSTERHRELLLRTIGELSQPAGNLFHDIATAVLLREHGIREIDTADSDFLQFSFLKVINPLLNAS